MTPSAATLIASALLALGAMPAHAQARPFEMGFTDSVFQSTDGALRGQWYARAVDAGADAVDLTVGWAGIAADRPADPADPADPAYRWAALDAAVTDAAARGLDVVLGINRAPSWAEGARRSTRAAAGTWRPSPAALGSFARALAQRYNGTHVPPGATAALPRVRLFKVWGEPNLATNLTPQWTRRRGKYRMFSPGHYRRMLNAGYAAIKAVRADNRVGAAGTAPFGDLDRGGDRIPPLAFTRAVLCLNDRLRRRCRSKARFDAWSHDPYSIGSPRRRALNRDDASVADMGKFPPVLRAAVRQGTALPRRAKQVWVSEVSWDSGPPDPDGVPVARHAQWLQESMHILWRSGVSKVFWFQIRDADSNPSFGSTYQSGIHYRDGRAKPAQQAFRFPFVAERRGVWGRPPVAGSVTIQRLVSGEWRTVATVRTGQSRVFTKRISLYRGATLRAMLGGDLSLPVRVAR